MTEVDNGGRLALQIDGVFDGMAGVARGYVSFVPNRAAIRPGTARAGILDGQPVRLAPVKDTDGPFWTSRFEPLS